MHSSYIKENVAITKKNAIWESLCEKAMLWLNEGQQMKLHRARKEMSFFSGAYEKRIGLYLAHRRPLQTTYRPPMDHSYSTRAAGGRKAAMCLPTYRL